MTRRHAVARLRSQAGFTITEMMVASAVMIGVTGGVFSVLNPAQGTFQAQPEVSDMQQRLRVAVDTLRKDLVMAGAGTYMGGSAGALLNYFAPVMPYRRGELNDDVTAGVFYRSDTISIMYVPPTPAQTQVVQALGNNSQEISVEPQFNCPDTSQLQLCGFEEGMRILIFDIDGSYDATTLTNIQSSALHLQHSGKLSSTYSSGNAQVSQMATHTYYLKSDTTANTYQLMHYDGYQTDLPVVDNVVKLEFQYFGDPQPPQLLPNVVLSSTTGPWTTYGPKPPPLGTASSPWSDGENCVFKVVGGAHVPRLDTLATGATQVKLDASILDGSDETTRGAWCPNSTAPTKFDADLLRIRRIRVNLRVQAALAALRGPAGTLFTRGGTSSSTERFVPDQEIRFDVTPRNMNLGR